MSRIEVVAFAATTGGTTYSRITELLVINVDGVAQLFSATRYDGVLQHWQLSSAGLTPGDTVAFAGTVAAGGQPLIVSIETPTNISLLTGGAVGGALQQVLVDGSGIASDLPLTALPAAFKTLHGATAIELGAATYVYGAFANQVGIGVLAFDASGALVSNQIHYDPAIETVAQLNETAIVEVGGNAYLLSVSGTHNGLASRPVALDGSLGAPTIANTTDGLWISAASTLATVEMDGRGYAIIGAAGSGSLSVVEVRDDGTLTVLDHLLDNRDTRFGGVAALDTIQHAGKTYVIAGGADDGLSVFVLLDDGRLVHRATIEDTDEISLSNLSAVATIAGFAPTGFDLFAASSAEDGITQLRYDTGAPGTSLTAAAQGGPLFGTDGFDILTGLGGADLIEGRAGDDILRDGAGSDVLSGGAGADLFMLIADGAVDRIIDFSPSEDQLDLSLWPMLRDISQLTFSLRDDGMELRYGDELLIVQSADGSSIDYRTLKTQDLIGGPRLPVAPETGFPGPLTPTPDLTSPPPDPPASADFDPLFPPSVLAQQATAQLRGAMGTDNQIPLLGDTSANLLLGQAEDDVIIAFAGEDIIDGGAGSDLIFGNEGDDGLYGGTGADRLIGGAGDDQLAGEAGNDLLTGGAGADTFIFNAGDDVIDDFVLGEDDILLDARLWTGLTSPEDLLMIYATVNETGTIISFETGDTLSLLEITDLPALADDIALF